MLAQYAFQDARGSEVLSASRDDSIQVKSK
jgi:hypothetical protein